MHEVIVDYEYRPVVAGINGLIDIKWTGGVLLLRQAAGGKMILGPEKDGMKSSARKNHSTGRRGDRCQWSDHCHFSDGRIERHSP